MNEQDHIDNPQSCLPEYEWSDRHRELFEAMSDISEEYYCAGWMEGVEFEIWNAMQSDGMHYGIVMADAEQFELCRTLSQELCGWIFWPPCNTGARFDPSATVPCFVPMSRWLEIVADVCK